MTELTQAQWEAMTQAERDKHLRDLVRWPNMHKPFPIKFDGPTCTGRVVGGDA